jgi:DMSO/TMAO reductase YedYZ molybdopterin-dependent catalytic subunit
VPTTPTPKRPPPEQNVTYSQAEVELAFPNHGQPAEMLREPISPLGMHFLLIHFDIPQLDATDYRVTVAGRVRTPMVLTLDELKARPSVTQPVTLECAGTGRTPWPRGRSTSRGGTWRSATTSGRAPRCGRCWTQRACSMTLWRCCSPAGMRAST